MKKKIILNLVLYLTFIIIALAFANEWDRSVFKSIFNPALIIAIASGAAAVIIEILVNNRKLKGRFSFAINLMINGGGR